MARLRQRSPLAVMATQRRPLSLSPTSCVRHSLLPRRAQLGHGRLWLTPHSAVCPHSSASANACQRSPTPGSVRSHPPNFIFALVAHMFYSTVPACICAIPIGCLGAAGPHAGANQSARWGDGGRAVQLELPPVTRRQPHGAGGGSPRARRAPGRVLPSPPPRGSHPLRRWRPLAGSGSS